MANIQGFYQPIPDRPPKIKGQSMALATAVVSAKEIAEFQILRIPGIPGILQTAFKKDQFTKFNASRFPAADDPDGHSALGAPIYGRIILGNDNGDNTYTDAQGKPGSFKTVELDCAIVTIDFNSKVVVTNIQGLPQSIKEFISSGDNDITITGIYDSTPGVSPVDFIMNLKEIFSAPMPIPVTNHYLNNLDINYIVVMPGTAMGQEEGKYATQTFTIKAISDTPMDKMLP